jgi:hypothetical protein
MPFAKFEGGVDHRVGGRAGDQPFFTEQAFGHSQISVTLDIYSHVLPTPQLEAAGKMDTILRAGVA